MAASIPFNRRSYQREKVELIGRYFLKNISVKHLGCTVINLSRNGAGALFPFKEKLKEGTPILLDISTPSTFDLVSVEGNIKRVLKRADVLYAGIQFTVVLPEDVFRILCGLPSFPAS